MLNHKKRSATVSVRAMIRRDLPEVLTIEELSLAEPWNQRDFEEVLQTKHVMCFVAFDDHDHRILGFMVFKFHLNHIELWNIAVHPDRRCEGIGTRLMEKFRQKMADDRCGRTTVRESELRVQQFLRACDWMATSILHDHFDDENGIRFQVENTNG